MIRKGLSGLAVLFIITTFLAAGVAGYEYNQYNQMAAEYNVTLKKYHVMMSQYQPLNNTYHSLLTEYNSLKSRYNNISTSYSNLQVKYSSLKNDYHKLQNLYNTLKTAYSSLQNNYTILQSQYDSLKSEYDSLNSKYSKQVDKYNSLYENYTKLVSQWNDLVDQWNNLVDEYNNLTINYDAWYTYARGVIYFTNATIPRVYSQEQYNYLYNIIVNNVSLTDPSDWWLSVQELYQYEINNVNYTYDEPELEPPWIQDLINGTYRNVTADNSIMTPNETLELRQGDCDDQAILLYGLIDTYEKYILGTDHVEWLVSEKMGNGEWHMTVFIPIQGGNLTITDPAGQYLTLDQNGQLTANNALQELQNYSDYWSGYGGVKYIELYEIRGDKAYMVANGTIYDIVEYITSITT